MAYLTPPSTGRKTRGVFNKHRQPTYYEDVYAEMNKDEELQGRPDRCDTESESDSDCEILKSPPKLKALPRTPNSLKKKRGVQDVRDGRDDHESLFVSEDEDELAQFKIAPKFNPKTSVALPTMTPRTFGMFAGQKHANEAEIALASTPEPARTEGQSPERNRAIEPESGKRIKRPASRRLLKQQLAQHDKAKKEALRAERASERAAKEVKKAARVGLKGKATKGAPKLHWNEVRHIVKENDKNRANKEKRTKKSKEAKVRKSPIVLIDNSDIDPGEYRRFDARGAAVVT